MGFVGNLSRRLCSSKKILQIDQELTELGWHSFITHSVLLLLLLQYYIREGDRERKEEKEKEGEGG